MPLHATELCPMLSICSITFTGSNQSLNMASVHTGTIACLTVMQAEIQKNQAELREAIADRAALEQELQTADHARHEAASL